MYRLGIDVGSTTLKCVIIDDNGKILYSSYERHYSKISEKLTEVLGKVKDEFSCSDGILMTISGSAGMGLAEKIGVPFVQEVFATKTAVKNIVPDADCVIELGGEDAKILFLKSPCEVRMNGSCAGGTGAFVDQMATLLALTADEMNELSKDHSKIYSIASRCGVFAKSDIQPLVNQGASKEDISASIFAAVVNQTIGGLAQGRKIEGKVVYLGGPLTFLSELRKSFDKSLKLEGVCPENSLYFVALGAAENCDVNSPCADIEKIIESIENLGNEKSYSGCNPLFNTEEEYNEFKERHTIGECNVEKAVCGQFDGYIGIDAGSTTVKCVLIDSSDDVVFSVYTQNSGNPVPIVKSFLLKVYEKYPEINIKGSAVTGYGEEIIKNAFFVDMGIVETIAHFTAAKKYDKDVDFIIDIGGQDIKCFKIKNGVIDNIFLNEACSSGCGSFLQTFAGALGYDVEEFSKLGIFADMPVDLGSRCTVFMNSSVKQAQKDGATIENISAGLSISVVKNALYKVIRTSSANLLGDHIVVQGGTFLNDAVLRAFEQEIGKNVTRPAISGLMGAYGAALYAKQNFTGESKICSRDELANFTHEVKAVTCTGCTNGCRLTVNTFSSGRKFIGGNQCSKGVSKNSVSGDNAYEYKRELLANYKSFKGERETVGLPFGLNMYELLPFWYTLFKELGFGVEVSPESNKKTYLQGHSSIPSDTVCYPAKLMHGHIESLVESGVDVIFYPCLTYNFDEGLSDNHFNCPVVAYYPEVIGGNMNSLKKVKYIYDYLGIHNRREFYKKFYAVLTKHFDNISLKEVKKACDTAYIAYEEHMDKIANYGRELLEKCEEGNIPVIVLAGRPYHVDREINHGIDTFIRECGAAVLSEDSLADYFSKKPRKVLNQWTYHARMYSAAEYITSSKYPKLNLVQLVSFGCGVDAVTTDEVREKLESNGKIYTQIKIDEITNLGAVKIRLRSLFSALEQQERERSKNV